MYTIDALNVNDAYTQGMCLLAQRGVAKTSRNGPVLVMPEPVTTHYRFPQQRVLFDAARDANPFFHLFEALWMLSGADDIAVPAYFVKQMAEYSDDGVTQHAAYGKRWNRHGQLERCLEHLRQDPDSRRAIISIWDATIDGFPHQSKDFPCNTTLKFWIDQGALNMVVFNRSNDIIWGCYGANAVHFSFLQEYMASLLRVNIGFYEQVSCDFHAYRGDVNRNGFERLWPLANKGHTVDCYQSRWDPVHKADPVNPMDLLPKLAGADSIFSVELEQLMNMIRLLKQGGSFTHHQFKTPFLEQIALPMLEAHWIYRTQGPIVATAHLFNMETIYGRRDWIIAGQQWMSRRKEK